MTGSVREPSTRGETIVELLSLLERTMQDVERTLPAVDHLSLPPGRPTLDERARIGGLVASSSSGVRDTFERWCASEDAFRAAVSRLEELRVHEKGEASFQSELTRRIHAVRDARARVHELAEALRAEVALEIGNLTHGHSGEATISP